MEHNRIKRLNESSEGSKNQTYLLVYMKETDGEVLIETLTSKQIKEKVKDLDYSDYAIVDGNVLKSFNSKSIDLSAEEANRELLKIVSLLSDVVQIAKYLNWRSDVGNQKAQKIIDEIHSGKHGRKDGIWLQVDDALGALKALKSNMPKQEKTEKASSEDVVRWPKIGQKVIVKTENKPIGTVLKTKKVERGVEIALIDFGVVERWIIVSALQELDT